MYFSFFERLIISLRNLGNHRPLLKPFVIIVTPLLRFCDYIRKKLTHNTKKIGLLLAAGIVFLFLFGQFLFGENIEGLEKVNAYDYGRGVKDFEAGFLSVSPYESDENYKFKADEFGFRADSDQDNQYSIIKEDTPKDAEEVLAANTKKQLAEQVKEESELANLSADDWRLILVNKQHPIPEGYEFELGTIYKGMKCDARIIDDLSRMIDDAADKGVSIIVCSPYRNDSRQNALFDNKIMDYREEGLTYMESYALASTAVTVPGSSEHQIGLALDLISNNYSSLNAGFAQTQTGIWLEEHSWEYGFTLRYPKGKEYITGIEFEPWHFRYVGVAAAKYMKENGICLEELIDQL